MEVTLFLRNRLLGVLSKIPKLYSNFVTNPVRPQLTQSNATCIEDKEFSKVSG